MHLKFDFEDTNISGVKIISPFFNEDERGYFLKNYEKNFFKTAGISGGIDEEFDTYSKQNVIRGLHFQIKEPQIKIVRVVKGAITDVVVDLRKESSTFGKIGYFELNDSNHKILYIPAGFAHGFCVRSNDAIVNYKCIGRYRVEYDSGILWNDSELQIDWKVDNPIVSSRDCNLMKLEEFVKKYKGI